MLRREVLKSLLALAAMPVAAKAGEPGLQTDGGRAMPFSMADVRARAASMASRPYRQRPMIPDDWVNISYDDYRGIWFDARNALYEGTETPVSVDVFPPGLYFPRPIEIYSVSDGVAAPVAFDLNVFDRTDQFPDLTINDSLGYSGLRLRAELEKPGIFQEFAVFQGASYFRGIGTGQIYGISARGLALNTAEPSGEEFPDFTAFWVERPASEQEDFVVHALLDSPSCTGAYRFRIRPGATLVMDIEAEVFARTDLTHVGIGPLTSMFMFDETNRERFSDFRPAVHDSDGLLIQNGGGETIWRPLANHKSLQISAFLDDDPKGFGLMQRARKYSDFHDLEALYHRRPGLWVTPGEGWGRGSVTLIEIPTDREIFDNIVSYWRPAEPIQAGTSHKFSYRLDWGGEPSLPERRLRVLNTRMGSRPEGGLIIAIDFEASPDVPEDLSKITRLIRASNGEVSDGVLQRNPETGGPRLAFTFKAGEATFSEFRAQLRMDGDPLSEVWLYRWTA